MPSPIAVGASERGVDLQPAHTSSSQVSSRDVDLLRGPDPSIHMLGLPKSHPQLGRWLVLALFAGAVAAYLLVTLTN